VEKRPNLLNEAGKQNALEIVFCPKLFDGLTSNGALYVFLGLKSIVIRFIVRRLQTWCSMKASKT